MTDTSCGETKDGLNRGIQAIRDWMIPFKEGRLVSQQSPIDKSVEQLVLDGQELDTDGEAVILPMPMI